MKSYFVEIEAQVKEGGLLQCIEIARMKIEPDSSLVARVYSARAGEKHARVVGEVTGEGFTFCRSGRLIPIRALRRRR